MIETSTSTLGKIGKVCMCKRILKEQTSPTGDIPFYKISTFGDKADCYISREIYEDYKTRFSFPKKGDILISAAGTLGRTVIYDGEDAFFQDSNIVWIDNDETKVLNDYLYYFYQTNPWIRTFGSTISRLYNDNIRSVSITYPKDIGVQKEIVNVLKTIDLKISNNNAICSDLEAMTKLLYDYWFIQFDFPDKNGKPYKSSGGKMVWNDELKREIPEGWEVHPANAYLDIVKGISYTASDLLGDGIKMLNLNSFNEDGSYKVEGIKTFSGNAPNERTLLPNDLIMCTTQQTDIDLSGKKNVIGKALLVPDLEETMTFSMDVCKLVSDNKKYLPFFKYQFGLSHAHKYIVGYANGTKIKHLDVANALSLPVAMPGQDSSLIDRFSDFAFSINGKISEIIKENQQLASLRDFLLPMLMNGQVKVGEVN